MKPVFKLPATPFTITQQWGVRNPVYDRFGFRNHNGVDFLLGTGNRLHAPYDCRITEVGDKPQGAGVYVRILSLHPYEWPDGKTAYAMSNFMHMERVSVRPGKTVKQGQLLGIADNTGFSTGPHTHWCLKRETFDGSRYTVIDKNDADDSIDPMPFCEPEEAVKRQYLGIIASLQAILAALQAKVKPARSLVDALIQVESGGDDNAIGDLHLKNKAYGPLQIRKPYIEDVNRANGTRYKAEDMLGNRLLSVWAYEQYMRLYATPKAIGRPVTDEDRARIHNGGPDGWKRKSTLPYWEKVKKHLT